MKKYAFFLLASLALGSCEQSELEEFMESRHPVSSMAQTRAAASLSDFDQVNELIGLPLNIINVGNPTFKYLSVVASGDKVDLYDKDDASGRQRWYLEYVGLDPKYPTIILKNGNPMCNNDMGFALLSAKCQNQEVGAYPEYPILKPADDSYTLVRLFRGHHFREIDNKLYLAWGGFSNTMIDGLALNWLQPKSVDSKDFKYIEESHPNDSFQWTLVPVGEYKIIDVQYEKNVNSGDYIIPKAIYCEGIVVDDLSVSITREVSIQKTFKTSSRFTETSNVVTQNQSSFSWSLGFGDVSLVHIGFDGSIDNSVTNEQSVSYENYEENTTTITKGYTLQIAPHTPCRIEILKMTYNASLTYVLTLEKVGGEESGKRFRIKGKWDGVVLSDLYFRRSTVDGNTELETQLIPENAQTVQIGY